MKTHTGTTYLTILTLYIIGLISPLHAGIDFLHNEFGSKSFAMGGANMGLSAGPEAIFYNPARPVTFSESFTKIESGQRLGIPFIALSSQSPFNIDGLRFGYIHSSVSGIRETRLNERNNPQATGGSFSHQLHGALTSLSLGEIAGIHAAAHGVLFHEQLKDQQAFAFSAGGSLYKQFDVLGHKIGLGGTVKNLLSTRLKWTSGHEDKIPTIWRGGASIQGQHRKYSLSADLDIEKNRAKKLFFGAEYWLNGHPGLENGFALRAGSRHGDITVGVGLRMAGITIDYATSQAKASYLENEHRFSIGWTDHRFPKNPAATKSKSLRRLMLKNKIQALYRPRPAQKSPPIPEPKPLDQPVATPQISEPDPLMWVKFIVDPRPFRTYTQVEYMDHRSRLRINNNDVTDTADHNLPIQVIAQLPGESNALIMDVDTNSTNHVLITGTLPPNYKLLINNRSIAPKKLGHFFYKSTQGIQTAYHLDVVVYRDRPLN